MRDMVRERNFARLEEHRLASRQSRSLALPFCRCACPSGASRREADGAAPGRVAFDRMAEGSLGAHKILVLQPAPPNLAEAAGKAGQTSLGHRARLRGTQTGVGLRPLRRSWLARLPPSRHIMHCRLRVPGQRADPFFPLCPQRPYWTTRRQTATRLSGARFAAFVPNGIIRTRSPH